MGATVVPVAAAGWLDSTRIETILYVQYGARRRVYHGLRSQEQDGNVGHLDASICIVVG